MQFNSPTLRRGLGREAQEDAFRRHSLCYANNQIVRYTVSGAGTNTPALSNPLLIRELPPEDAPCSFSGCSP